MQTIIVGADGTGRAEDALSFAQGLSTVTGARVELVHVLTSPGPWEIDLYEPYLGMLREESRAMLRRMSALAGDGPALGSRSVVSDAAAHGLQDVASELDADLIVVGSSHVGHLGRVFPGSTGERLLHGAPCPVAIVPRGLAGKPWGDISVIGVGDDHGREAARARDVAVQLARATGASLQVIGACDVIGYATPALLYGPGYYRLREDVRAGVRDELDETVASLPADIEAQAVMREGDPAAELVAASHDLDLLVLGSRGYGPMHAVLAGGVSGRVTREAACPVLVVPRGAATGDVGRPTVTADATA